MGRRTMWMFSGTILILLSIASPGRGADALPDLPLLSLHLRDVTVEAAFKELFRSIGQPMPRSEPEDLFERDTRRVSISARQRSFWDIAEALAEQTGIRFTTHREEMVLQRQPVIATHLSGPVRVQIARLSRVRELRYGTDYRRNDFEMELVISIDPRLPVTPALTYQVDLDPIQGVDGRPVTVTTLTRNELRRPSPTASLIALFAFPPDLPPNLKLTSFKGRLTLPVTTRAARIELPDLATLPGSTHDLGAVRIEFVRLDVSKPRSPRLDVKIEHVEGADAFWASLPQGLGAIRLLDPRDRAFGFGVREGRTKGKTFEGRVHFYTARLPDLPADHLVWDVPLETQSIVVPFEFKGLVLP